MILFFTLFFNLVSVLTASPQDRPSYRSTVMEGDKPILRTDEPIENNSATGDADKPILRMFGPEENDPDVIEVKLVKKPRRDPVMVRDLTFFIAWLADNFGYRIVTSQARRNKDLYSSAVNPTDNNLASADASEEKVKKTRKHPNKPPNEKHVKMEKRKIHRQTPPEDHLPYPIIGKKSDEPRWVLDLKEFIKDLITRYGHHDLISYTKPVIASLEKKHNVKVLDIDVDQYGEIMVNFKDKPGKKEKPKPKALRILARDEIALEE